MTNRVINPFVTIEEALVTLKQGRMIVLVDAEDRENEGDLVICAEYATPEVINFMSLHARGLICLPMAPEMIEKLKLPMMVQNNKSPYGTAFTVSIEAASGVSTGISAADRAHTIQVAIDPNSGPDAIISPGHMFPLIAKKKGVLARAGQTEGSVDLARLAGLKPAAVICEIMNEDGSMSRLDHLIDFSKRHDIPLVKIQDLIHYRIRHESLAKAVVVSRMPLRDVGDFNMFVFQNELDSFEHIALIKGEWGEGQTDKTPLVRIHSECITGDLFGSCRCDCGSQLKTSLELISKEGGILIYLRQEGRGIGLANKLRAYNLQDTGMDTVDANIALGLPADARDYAVAFQMLKHLNITRLNLLTNNPAKVKALETYGLIVEKRISVMVTPSSSNVEYLRTKQTKLGHLIDISD